VKRVQVAVVGGGDAGDAAARAAFEAGAEVNWFEEHTFSNFVSDIMNRAPRLELGHVVWGLFTDNVLGVVTADTSFRVQADQIILATGETDLPCPFFGGSLPGVFTSRAVRVMINEWRLLPGNKFVVIGDSPDASGIVQVLGILGAEIVAHVRALDAANLVAFGTNGVEAVEINGRQLEADVIVVAVGRQPDVELALMAGCEVAYCEQLGGFIPIRDENLRTSVRSILVAGEAAGLCEPHVAAAEGRFAGICAAQALNLVDDSLFELERASYLNTVGDRLSRVQQLTNSYGQV
jgi:sarcosine oxidase subunit alpha